MSSVCVCMYSAHLHLYIGRADGSARRPGQGEVDGCDDEGYREGDGREEAKDIL